MSRVARLRVRMGTALLPPRELQDQNVSIDIFDIPIEDGERVMQLDLNKQPGYRTVRHAPSEELVEAGAAPGERDRQVRDKTLDHWKWRAVTVQEIDYQDAPLDQLEAGLDTRPNPQTDEIVDVEYDELPPGEGV